MLGAFKQLKQLDYNRICLDARGWGRGSEFGHDWAAILEWIKFLCSNVHFFQSQPLGHLSETTDKQSHLF